MEIYDIGIIGGGPGGYSTALYYAGQGKTVVLFEKDEIGGTCLNRGCIPTKAFLHVAEIYSQINCAEKLGINIKGVNIDFEKVFQYKNSVVEKLRKGLELTLKNAGIKVVKGLANITSKKEIQCADIEYQCKEIIIATGSKPKEIKGLEYDNEFILSSDDILNITKLPKDILIVGSGAIGIEWARILSAFGVETTIVELADKLCPIADWEVSKRIERIFKTKKIKIYTSTFVEKIENKTVFLSNGEALNPQCILVAIGRETVMPENTNGIKVIGDASAEIMLAHYAVSQAKELALELPFNKNVVPSVIYGNPEIAWVGEVSKSKEDDEKYDKSMILVSALGKAHCDNNTEGFIKILSQNGKIKGASIVSAEGSALIQQIAIAIDNDLSVTDLKKVCFAHPTYSEGIMESIMRL
ncbi:FAD-dependent oxidoreductase [bacterium]|nr:FAD-dependent oxidoreductase [bacterium]